MIDYVFIVNLFNILDELNKLYCKCSLLENIYYLAFIITAVLAVIQFSMYKKQEKTQLLLKYNERYSHDKNIEIVVRYMLNYNMNEEYNPYPYPLEMFMRFFEELEVQITEDKLKTQEVENLFAYYAVMNAILLSKKGNNIATGIDYNVEVILQHYNCHFKSNEENESWERYVSFVNRFPALAYRINNSLSNDERSNNRTT